MALGQVFHRVLLFSSVSIIAPVLLTDSFIYHRQYVINSLSLAEKTNILSHGSLRLLISSDF